MGSASNSVSLWLKRCWPLLVFAFAAVIPIWRAVLLGEQIGPVDQIRSMAPWNGSVPAQPWDVLQADGVLQFAPWRYLVLDAWSKGQPPLWNAHQLMGTPLLANSQSAGFYPFHVVLGLLRVPLVPAMTFLAWLHLFLASLGTYVLCIRMRALKAGAALAGVSFSLSAFMLSWTVLPSVITTVCWIPWVLSFAIGVFQSSSFWGILSPATPLASGEAGAALEELGRLPHARMRSLLGLGLSCGLMLLGGHLQFAAFGFLALSLAILVLGLFQAGIFWRGKGLLLAPAFASMATCGLGLILGALLAAPQLLPVLEFSRHSNRVGVATDQGYQAYRAGAIQPFELAGIVFPSALGHPLQGSDEIPHSTGFWPAYVKQGGNFAESALGIGPLVFLLLFLIPRRKWAQPESVAMLAVALLGLAIATGTVIDRLLYFNFPGWSATASPGRAGMLFVLGCCVLASLAPSVELSRLKPISIAIPTVLALVSCIFPFYLADSLPDPYHLGELLPKLVASSLVRAIPAIAVVIILSIGALFALPRRFAGVFLSIAAAAVAMGALNWTSPIPVAPSLTPPDLKVTGRYAAVNKDWQLLVPPGNSVLLPPNTASLFGFNEVAGYDSLLDRDTKAMLDSVNGQDSAPASNGNMLLVKPSASLSKLGELGVEEVLSTAPLAGLSGGEKPIYRYRTGGVGRVDNEGRPASPIVDGYDRASLTADGPGMLTVRDRNMEGWSARVDSAETPIPSGFFRRVKLEPGRHRIEFSYSPPGYKVGLRLLVLGLSIVVLLVGFQFRKRLIE